MLPAPALPSVSDVLARYEQDPTTPLSVMDWRTKVYKFMKQGDVEGMRNASLPAVQYNILRMALEDPDSRVQASMSTFVMGQAGHGIQNSVTINHRYDQLPEDQLLVLLKSKMEQLQQLNPNFSLEKLFLTDGQPAIDAELVEQK